MKRLILLASIAALGACSSESVEEEIAEEQQVAPGAMMAADGQPFAGTFEMAAGDETMTYEVAEDGTFVRTSADGTASTGRFEDREGQRCAIYDMPDGTEGETFCATEGTMAGDGSWTVTGADGSEMTARRLVVETDGTEAPPAPDAAS